MIKRLNSYIAIFMAVAIAIVLLPAVAIAQTVSESLPEDPVNLQYWQVLTGFALPPLLSFIQQSKWTQKTQAAVAFGVSIVVTLGQMWIYGQLDNFTDPAQAVLLVLALTIAFYKGFFKPLGISPAIEKATNISRFA